MGLRRYARSATIGINGSFGTSKAIQAIRDGISAGVIRFETLKLGDGQRLDSLAGELYNDAKLWWVIAAASEIGWSLQCTGGTILRIPNLSDVANLVG